MSITEIMLILIIGVFVLKPSDIKSIAQSIKEVMAYFNKVKSEIWNSIGDDEKIELPQKEQLNNYLAKIIQLYGKYEGNYDLASVKAYYHKLLIQHKIDNNTKQTSLK